MRVQGGAYGAGIHVDRNGNLLSYSFRDPTPGKTLEADAGASGFLRDFAKLDGEMDKYIISSLNELNPLMNSRDKGFAADIRYLAGYTRAQAEKIRKEILYATPEDLAACGKILDAFAAEGNVCIVAHTDALRDCDLESIRDL